ncbi:MAG: outer membrane beta-barrel protein [Dysgonomonas sp.]|nr:outer membrane beta-barrel protein [Dysgonomonas sp.]
MRSDKDNIKDIFSSKLGSFEPELPPFGWERIDAGLSAQQESIIPPKKHRTPIYKAIPWLSAAAAIILAVLFLYPRGEQNNNALALCEKDLASQKSGINKQFIAKSNVQNKVEIASPIKSSSSSILGITRKSYYSPPSTNIQSVQNSSVYIAQETEKAPNKNEETVPTEIYTENKTEETYIAENKNQETQDSEEFEKELAEKIAAFEASGKANEDLLAENPPKDHTRDYNESHSPRGLEVGINGGGAFSKTTETQNQLRLASMELLTQDGNQIINTYKSRKMKLDHNQPINFGVTINKKLTNRLSIESGIMYTYLSSRIRSIESMDYNLKDYQQFHYLGIPVTFNYKLVEWKKLQLYISAGGAIQKDIYGRMKTNEDLESLIEMNKYESKNISQDHPQFSLTTSIGVSYPIYKKMSAYTNLGGSYYIDAKNKYETIYSDRKWIFNINLGVKFGF